MNSHSIPTEGVKYAGSKRLLIPQILELVRESGVETRTVWDAFSGTTRVSQALAKSGYSVISSDISPWSEVFATCYLKNRKEPEEYEALIRHLNSVPPVDGWFTEHYGGDVLENSTESVQLDGFKKPFQRHNMRKLDGIRTEIDALRLEPVARAVALTSLMLALDEVDSTLGHFSSYLREWAPRSYREMKLGVPKVFVNELEHRVLRGDVFELAPEIRADFAYFDPPYGSNNEKMPPSRVRYAAYYHFWTTLIQNDRPELFGKVMRRVDSSDVLSASVFEEFRRTPEGRFIAVEAIRRMLAEAPVRWILLSYSSGGRATAGELLDVVRSVGELRRLCKVDYRKNVMADMRSTNEWTSELNVKNQEFLFLIEKNKSNPQP